MAPSVETVCTLLARSRLLPPDEVKALHQRWRAEAKDAADNLRQFRKWLVAHRYITRFQAKLLLRGHTDSFFLNKYKILERIGKGRIAGVYKAVHHLGQVVAVKVLPPSKAQNPRLLARFQREAVLGRRLKHAHVVRTFQKGEANGLHYIVQEYLEGESLQALLHRHGKLPPQEAMRVVHQALLGLQHLHEKGVVHRELEPGNLMLVPGPDETGSTANCTVKILDLGQAREAGTHPGDSLDPPVTREGELLGVAAYLAPEQARDPHHADIRADLYSLGCVLYHALTGQPPFPDENVLRQVLRHANEPPRPLSDFLRDAPPDLQVVVATLLAKDPNQRYHTPQQAAEALDLVLSGGTTLVQAPAAQPHLDAFLKWLETDSTDDIPPPPPALRRVVKRRSKRRASRARPPESPPVRPAPASEIVGPTAAEASALGALRPRTGRDWLFVAAGVLGLAILQVLGWLLWRLLVAGGPGSAPS